MHLDIRIFNLPFKPGIKLRLMRLADLYQVTGYATWSSEKEMKIEAEGSKSKLNHFLSSIENIQGIDASCRLESNQSSEIGYREFSILDY